jgi:PAS domain S-box-containing protein
MSTTGKSIRRRLMTMMMLTSAASIGLAAVTFIVFELLATRSETQERLATLARIVASNSTAALAFKAEEDAYEVLATLRTEPHVIAAALYDENGRIFATYPRNLDRSSIATTAGPTRGFDFIGDRLEGLQTVSEVSDRTLGALFLRADMKATYRRFSWYGAIAIVITLLSLLLAYILSNVFQRRISGPISALANAARTVSERGDFSVRAPTTNVPELDALTTTFNHMLERIDTQSSALRENEMRLRAVLNSALSAVIVMDAQGKILEWNTTAEKIFGWSRAEALQAKLGDLIIPERMREQHQRGLERYLAGGVAKIIDRKLELSALRRDGTEFPAELSVSVLRGPEVTFCGFATDVTERQQARAKTQAQLARLDLLQRTTRAIAERQDLLSIYQVILRSLEDDMPIDFGCVCEYDAAARTLTVKNTGSPTITGLDLVPGMRLPLNDAAFARCISGALVYEPDIAAVPLAFAQQFARSGLRSFVAAPLLVENEIFGVLLVARAAPNAFSSGDCEFLRQLSEHVALAAHQVRLNSELQRAYDDLRQSQQVIMQQERLRALGQMASGVAHDINNAISPIALYTESLLEREPNLSERARDYLRIIQRAIEDVAQTVAKMREFYRRRDQVADLQPIELNPLVEQVLQSTRARWSDIPQERGIVIEARSDLDVSLPQVMGSESDIRDAITNLVFNAVDAMPNGGTLIVRTRRCDGAQPDDARVELDVVDSGIGMDEDTRRRCLEPFFTTKGERGTGMGLAMVYGMVRRHGAAIEIDSAIGAGTTIRVRFRVAVESSAQHTLAPTPVSIRPLRILVIDDDPLVLEAVRHTLASEGHTAEAADGGEAGIELFKAAHREGAHFDIVMTDLGMPFLDGRAVATAIKQISPATPVLLLTGWGERLQTEQTTPANVDRVLSKPPRMSELRRALAELSQQGSVVNSTSQSLELDS